MQTKEVEAAIGSGLSFNPWPDNLQVKKR